jgi:hypothetical protein
VGATSASEWWGPGIHNALVMSNNAAGIPQVYLRTSHPLRTRAGELEAHWLLGGLTESPFFDNEPRNDLRSLSAAVVTLRLAADTGLTIGAARAVYAATPRFGGLPGHLADVFLDWHRQGVTAPTQEHSDQITSLFARWVFPEAGFAAHVEWAKLRPPKSLRELLLDPQFGQGYTVGLEWANQLRPERLVRVQAEATMLEQTPEAVGQDISEFYVSHSVPQGYTQEGQVIGASIGPGSSAQYIDATLLNRNWQVGGRVGRIRWEEDAYFRSPVGFSYKAHDISLFWGLNGRFDSRFVQGEVAIMRTQRLNYLFQTVNPYDFGNRFDVKNTTLSLKMTPHLRPPKR